MSQPENELRAAAQAVIEWENEYRTLNNLGKYPPHVFIRLAAALASRAPATTPTPDEVAWLIEKAGLCLGFCEYRFAWVTFTDENAIRFSRQRDAYSFKEAMKYEKDWKAIFDAEIREHMWLAQAAAPSGKEPALGKVSFQLLTEKDVAEAYQAAPDWFTVLSALECRGKEPPRDEPDFGSAEEVIAGLDRINEHNQQVAEQDKPPAAPEETK